MDSLNDNALGERKTVGGYNDLDASDEALKEWKKGLLKSSDNSLKSDDPRTVILLALTLEVAGRQDITFDLTIPDAFENLTKHPFIIKEGSEYHMVIKFKVQHEIISALQLISAIKWNGMKNNTRDEMLGTHVPNTEENPVYTKRLSTEVAPSGTMGRGSYTAVSRFTDYDAKCHLKFKWSFNIRKEWE